MAPARLPLLPLALLLGGLCFVTPKIGLRSPSTPGRAPAVTRYMVEVPGGLKNGVKMIVDGDPMQLIQFQSKKQGKGVAITKAKLKNMLTGALVDKTFNSGSKYDEVETFWKVGTYSYKDEDEGSYHIMDMESFEDTAVPADVLGEMGEWLVEGQNVEFEQWGEKIVNVVFPDDIIMEITDIKQSKDNGRDQIVVLSNGISKQAPAYLQVGDKVSIDKKNFEITKRV
ncbi:unnamed protein product [Effrenium voratum]|nr:unnamed protein product [Effrenium voratum]|mmetsp:Transcript_101748/g.242636  ORF Transcript_101748/g.242636 Transcript_101748/m.242636 type:complete len:227 (+) Transcript_101748:35-715(+)|eukprot:CAMPEP_0181454994 /NCGR_PEP_ID=MMETSP1110-20121109/30529_1 /TAXON_ID=174948 /ORGANISM="Symbiodinium sp., Strain CCMP421" /LENGTH=226 /DNA_ID=CAMNT_0023579365 /DNA_START=35 /DNA_END=715 /DNA_ORIENTATION=+